MPSPLVKMLRDAADQIERLEAEGGSEPRNIRCMALMLEAAERECHRRDLVIGPWWLVNRDPTAIAVRRVAAQAAADRGFPLTAIARALGFHHSTIIHLLRGGACPTEFVPGAPREPISSETIPSGGGAP